MIELLEQTGALRVLMLLLEKPRFITELKSSSVNPRGIVSLNALTTIRANLKKLDLIREEIEEGPRPKTFLVITEKGRRVAEKVREILTILEG